MIQPDPSASRAWRQRFFRSAARTHHQFAESATALSHTLTGVARFRIVEEMTGHALPAMPAGFSPFLSLQPRAGEDLVDRDGVLRTLRDFAETNNLQIDWSSIHEAPNEALSMRFP